MSGLDWLVVVIYIIAMIGMSVYLGRTQKSEKDYYLGGNDISYWSIGISTMATQCSTNSLLGAPAFVIASGGLLWLQYEIAVPVAMIGIMIFLLPFFRKQNVVSVYEYLEARFGVGTRTTLSVLFQFLRAFATGVTVYGISLVLQKVVGIPFWVAVLVLGLVTVIYDFFGGMKAVVYSDVVQMFILYGGIILCLIYAIKNTGGISQVTEYIPKDKASGINLSGHGFGDGETFAFWPMLFGGLFLYLSYYGCDQTQVQRELSSKDVDDTNMSLFVNGIFRFPLVVTYCLVGIVLAAYIAKHPSFMYELPYKSAKISQADIKDSSSLALKIKNSKDEFSKAIRDNLSPETNKMLSEYSKGKLPEKLNNALIQDLNNVIANGKTHKNFYEKIVKGNLEKLIINKEALKEKLKKGENLDKKIKDVKEKINKNVDNKKIKIEKLNRIALQNKYSDEVKKAEEEYNLSVPIFVLNNLPHGIIGLIIVALFAAAMSSLDSTINSLSATTIRDLVERFFVKGHLDDKTQLLWSRVATVFWGVVCTIFAFFVGNISGSIIESINKIGSLANGPILATFLLAILTRKANGTATVIGIITGFLTNLMLWFFAPKVSWLWWNVIGCAVTFAVGYFGSFVIGKQEKEIDHLVYHKDAKKFFNYKRNWPVYYAILAAYTIVLILACYFIKDIIT